MGTKASPGKFDCYANAEPDEPIFVLLGRDVIGAHLVAAWTAIRASDLETAIRIMKDAIKACEIARKPNLPYDSEKSMEAQECSRAMGLWHENFRLAAIEKRLGG